MSEQLLEYLQVSFASHGVESERSGTVIRAGDGLAIEPRVFPREAVGGTVQVQADFAIESPRLSGVAILDSFAGVGDTRTRFSSARSCSGTHPAYARRCQMKWSWSASLLLAGSGMHRGRRTGAAPRP